MSSYKATAKKKSNGEIHEIWCMDDYFGKHIYGYIPNIEGGEALTKEQFDREYDFYDVNSPTNSKEGI